MTIKQEEIKEEIREARPEVIRAIAALRVASEILPGHLSGRPERYTLKLEDLEVDYLLRLVKEDDEKLKSHPHYGAYITLHNIKVKLEELARRVMTRQEDARDLEW